MSEEKKKKSEEEKKKFKYVPGAWKVGNDKKLGPGEYEVVRLMSVAVSKDDGEVKGKGMKRFASIPTLERARFGIINKVIIIAYANRNMKPNGLWMHP